MQPNTEQGAQHTQLDRRLNDIGWGLLLMLTGVVWLLPPGTVPGGTWFFGVAAILIGVNVARYAKHIALSAFSLTLGVAAFVAAISQIWRQDPPLVAIFLLAIGASLIARPLVTRTA